MKKYQYFPENGKICASDRSDGPLVAEVVDPWEHIEPSFKSAEQLADHAGIGFAMAASPQMLAALEFAVARVELANAEGDPILSAWLADARDAIKQAKGIEQ